MGLSPARLSLDRFPNSINRLTINEYDYKIYFALTLNQILNLFDHQKGVMVTQ